MNDRFTHFSLREFIPHKHNIVVVVFFIFLIFPGVKEWFSGIKLQWLYIFIFAFLICYFCTHFAIKIALRFGIVDKPDYRKTHATSTPILGGVAVYIAFASSIIFNNFYSLELKGVAISATLVFILGLVDDIKSLPAMLKIAVQIIAVSIMISYGVVADFLPNVWWGHALEIVITFIWMLGITNSLNFFDGVDGLATGLTVICSALLGILAIIANHYFLMLLSIALAGSCLGFLPYNFRYRNPALIFLGDSGSTFMGFMLAAMVIMGDWGEKTPIKAYAMPLLIMSIFIFDMVYTTVSRIATKKVVSFNGWLQFTGRDHLHHRIMNLGLGPKQTVFFICFLTASLGISAIALRHGNVIDAILLLIQASFIYFIIVILMVSGRFRNRGEKDMGS